MEDFFGVQYLQSQFLQLLGLILGIGFHDSQIQGFVSIGLVRNMIHNGL